MRLARPKVAWITPTQGPSAFCTAMQPFRVGDLYAATSIISCFLTGIYGRIDRRPRRAMRCREHRDDRATTAMEQLRVGTVEGVGEALTGESAGWVLSSAGVRLERIGGPPYRKARWHCSPVFVFPPHAGCGPSGKLKNSPPRGYLTRPAYFAA